MPYIANECWEILTKKNDLTSQEWPKIQDNLIKKDHYNIVIQINGKKRAIINAAKDENEDNILSKSLAIKNIKAILDQKIIKKKIFIKNKILNIVTDNE
jgi:leucyl-tRNA synthetase